MAGVEASVPPPAGAPSRPTTPARRAIQAIDDGRRGQGDLFGACKPAEGDALTAPEAGRTTAHSVDCLERVAAWIPPDMARVYAIMDTLSAQRAPEVLLFSLAHPRWEFVFQPT
jgi:hypothetical protein